MRCQKAESSFQRRFNHLLFAAFCLLFFAACSAPPPSSPTSIPSPTSTLPPPTATPLATHTPAPTPVPGGLYVDLAQNLGPVSPFVYGTNYGPWLFVPLEMQEETVAAKLSVVRFPGGNWGDQNDIDEWSLDQYIFYTRQWGAEPYITVRLRGGTPEKAAALVKYANITKQYNVRYWSIGNEPSLYGKDYTTDVYNQQWREWAEAMRAVDPSITLIGPEIHQFTANFDGNPKDSAGNDWMTDFLRVNGNLVDVVSFHRYPFPKNTSGGPPSIDDMRNASREWDNTIPYLNTLIREQTGRDIPIAVTEINSSWASNSGGQATMDSHYNAIWWGDSLGRMIRQGVFMVNQFAIISDYGLMDKYKPFPIYYIYIIYQKFGVERLYASSDNTNVSVFAARRADGARTIMVINLASSEATTQLTIANMTSSASAETWLFDKTHNVEQVEPTALGPTTSLTLPAESISLYIIPSE